MLSLEQVTDDDGDKHGDSHDHVITRWRHVTERWHGRWRHTADWSPVASVSIAEAGGAGTSWKAAAFSRILVLTRASALRVQRIYSTTTTMHSRAVCTLVLAWTSCVGGRHNMPRPLQVDLWPFDVESDVRVTCDVGYLCANFSLPRRLCSRLKPDVRDRQTNVRQTDVRRASSLNTPCPRGGA